MQSLGVNPSHYGLDRHGIQNVKPGVLEPWTAALVENAIRRREGLLAAGGAFVVRTGQYTGRSPDDQVRSEGTIDAGPDLVGAGQSPLRISPASTRYTGAS